MGAVVGIVVGSVVGSVVGGCCSFGSRNSCRLRGYFCCNFYSRFRCCFGADYDVGRRSFGSSCFCYWSNEAAEKENDKCDYAT